MRDEDTSDEWVESEEEESERPVKAAADFKFLLGAGAEVGLLTFDFG